MKTPDLLTDYQPHSCTLQVTLQTTHGKNSFSFVIRGEYYIKGDSITFYAITVFIPTLSELSRLTQNDLGMERITRDSITMMRSRPTSSNYWSLTGKDFRIAYQKVTLDPSKRYSASFFRQENDEYIEIDGERFYEDPGPED